jgi:hypothetical protein
MSQCSRCPGFLRVHPSGRLPLGRKFRRFWKSVTHRLLRVLKQVISIGPTSIEFYSTESILSSSEISSFVCGRKSAPSYLSSQNIKVCFRFLFSYCANCITVKGIGRTNVVYLVQPLVLMFLDPRLISAFFNVIVIKST